MNDSRTNDMQDFQQLRDAAHEALVEKRGGPARKDPTLPDCPLCAAPALALMPEKAAERAKHHGRWGRFDLVHDCDCAFDQPSRYDVGIERLHRESEATYTFVTGLPARYRRMLDRPLDRDGALRKAITEAEALEGGSFFYLFGTPGTGKTHLAIRTAMRHIGTGTGAFWTAAGVLEAIKATFDSKGEPPDLAKATALVLDDLGKERPTDWAAAKIYNAIDERYTDERTTIITSNYPPEVAAARLFPKDQETADAFLSRLVSGRVARVDGEDYRTEHHT